MSKLTTQLLDIVTRSPGHTVRELAELLRGPGTPQQAINQEARHIANVSSFCVRNDLMG